jgi:flagella basal body P-ring formation protein FlgA
MNHRISFYCLCAGLCILLSPSSGPSAEIKFRSECQVAGSLVTLADLAEISSAGDAEKSSLAIIDVFPAPAAGKKRALTSRQVQDLLSLRGLEVANHKFSGATQIMVLGPADAARFNGKTISPSAARQTQSAVTKALTDYLASHLKGDVQLKFTLSDEQLSKLGREPRISGGAEPWLGAQTFEISSGKQKFSIDVQVTQSPKVVVATTALPRGTIVQAADVELQESKSAVANVKAYASIEDVVGKEATRNITAGQVLDEQLVHAPIVVRRGEVVDIIARSAGIRVRVKGRSRGDGGLGDLVTVESVTDRKSFLARVSGAQEVEVFAQATAAETAVVR